MQSLSRGGEMAGGTVGAVALFVVIAIHAGGGPRHNMPSAGGVGVADHTAPEDGRSW